jgi:hypothetical protein
MGYRELYQRCQGFGPQVSRRKVYPETLALAGNNKIRHFKTTLDMTVCRGMYVSAQNTKAKFVQQAGSCVVVTARELNHCWERFVFIKELMHAFDNPAEATDSGDAFDTLLQELSGPSGPSGTSPQTESEFKCFWMALGVLCPENQRLDYAQRLNANQIDDYAIALELRIPKAYVPRLFEPRYKTNIEHLITPP